MPTNTIDGTQDRRIMRGMTEIRQITPAEYVLQPADSRIDWPEGSIVLGAFASDGSMVGRIAIIDLPHIEGTWVADKFRRGTLAFRLIRGIEDIMRRIGRSHVFAFAYDTQPEVSSYLERVGYKRMPLTVWVKEL